MAAAPFALHQSIHSSPARRIICREHDLHDGFPIMCSGWAASVITLSDGRRQIVSVLLPGDLISAALLFESRHGALVETITDVRYCIFKRSQLKSILLQHPHVFEKFANACLAEKQRADELITDLGRRTADKRIARLMLGLADRFGQRGMTVQGDTLDMDFPLRQHHIADATGLTPVHVSKVVSEFRRHGLIKIGDRSLTILDPEGFRRVADIHSRMIPKNGHRFSEKIMHKRDR